MPNVIDSSGIQIETYQEIVSDIVNGTADVLGLVSIYGSDINVDSNSPDGLWVNIFALSKQDILNLCVQIYNSFDPDLAVGIALDRLCALCGIVRQGGTYTRVEVTVNITGSLNLNGLDTSSPYTISDNTGNLFYLIATTSCTTGDNSLNFQSANIGFVQILPNTLTIPVTIIAGVNTVNNPSSPYEIGENQETDSALRIRRQASTAVPSQGFNQSLYGGLNTIDGLTQAVIYENVTDMTDANGIPSHSIWVIVNGGSDDNVADVIYTYRNAGCGMFGSTTVSVNQVDGTTFDIVFSRAEDQDLFISMTVSSLRGGSIDTAALKTALVAQYLFEIYQIADTTTLASLVHSINPDVLIEASGFSSSAMGVYTQSLLPDDVFNIWVLSTANIAISAV